jgi:hypothetical protein
MSRISLCILLGRGFVVRRGGRGLRSLGRCRRPPCAKERRGARNLEAFAKECFRLHVRSPRYEQQREGGRFELVVGGTAPQLGEARFADRRRGPFADPRKDLPGGVTGQAAPERAFRRQRLLGGGEVRFGDAGMALRRPGSGHRKRSRKRFFTI